MYLYVIVQIGGDVGRILRHMLNASVIPKNIANPSNMRRFLLCGNIERLTQALNSGSLTDNTNYIRRLTCQYRRELALLDAGECGAFNRLGRAANSVHNSSSDVSTQFGFAHIEQDVATMILDLSPGLKIVYVNEAFLTETGISQSKLLGRPVYDAFPDNPKAPESECVSHTFNAIKQTMKVNQPIILPDQRYDIRNPDGNFVECYWRIEFLPLPNANEEVEFIKLKINKIFQ